MNDSCIRLASNNTGLLYQLSSGPSFLVGWAKAKLEDVEPTHVPKIVDQNSLKVGLHSLGINFQDSTSTQSCKNIKSDQYYMIKFKFGVIPKINPKREEEAKVHHCWNM